MEQDDMYDEGTELDQEATLTEDAPAKDESEDVGEPFLAPKASFKGDLSPGTIHRVRIEESHDSELQLVCLGPEEGAEEPVAAEAVAPAQEDAMYE